MPGVSHEAGEHYEEWLKSLRIAGRAPKTVESYESTVKDLLEAYPDTAFGDFTPAILSSFLWTGTGAEVLARASRHSSRSSVACASVG
jgi:hypothetical protein